MTTGIDQGHSGCVFCGTGNPRSLRLSFQSERDDAVQARFFAEEDLQGYKNVLHGGIAAGLLDAAMTHCLFHRGVKAVTGDLHIRFVRAVTCPSCLVIRAWMLFSRPPLYGLRAEITSGGLLAVWAEAKFVRRREGPCRSGKF